MQKTRITIAILIFALAGGMLYMRLAGEPGRALELRKEMGFRPDITIVAHRGASYLAPEETHPAYILARELGADYLEIDLQRSKDGVLFGFHDDTMERTTNCSEIFPGREKDAPSTFNWDELQQLDTGSWFNKAFPARARPAYAGLKILKFSEFLALARGNDSKKPGIYPGIYIETKSPENIPGIEEQLIEALQEDSWLQSSSSPSRVILQSFSIESLQILKKLAPEIPLVLLISQQMEKDEGWNNLLGRARPVVQGLGPVGYLMWPWYTGRAHDLGYVVHVYTLNAGWQMQLANWFSVDGFFTDRSELALEKFRNKKMNPDAILKKAGY